MSDVRSLCHLSDSLHKCHKESIQSLTELALGDAEAVGAESADGLGIAADEGEEPDPAMSAGYVNQLCNSKAAELCAAQRKRTTAQDVCRPQSAPGSIAVTGQDMLDSTLRQAAAAAQLRLYSRSIRLEMYCASDLFHGLSR